MGTISCGHARLARETALRAVVVALAMVVSGGCRSTLWLPEVANRVEGSADVEKVVYELGDREVAFVARDPDDGRFTEMEVSRSGSVERVVFDDVPTSERRHLVLCLDGVPYELVRDLYDRGLLRTFYPPTPLVSVFPASSDMSFHRILGGDPPVGFESRYYDDETGRIEGGNLAYVRGTNEPWDEFLDYRLNHLHSAIQFTSPRRYFKYEIETLVERFSESQKRVFVAYFPSMAGLGTRYGRTGYVAALMELERATRQLIVDSEGRVTVTMLADHGQTLVPPDRLDLEAFLEERGFRVVKKLARERDVVAVTFGILTYAAIHTRAAQEVAEAVVELPQVDLATYVDGDAVVVVRSQGRASIRRRDGRYRYEVIEGDPLRLLETIDRLKQEGHVDAEGYVDDQALFQATATAEYPDACKRLWQAFHGLTKHSPDVIVSLKDNWCFGGKFFGWLTPVISTHAGLNYHNSVTFVMSTAGQLSGPIRVDDLGRGKVNE